MYEKEIKEEFLSVSKKYVDNKNYKENTSLASDELDFYRKLFFLIIIKFTDVNPKSDIIQIEKAYIFPYIFNNITDKVFRRVKIDQVGDIKRKIANNKATKHEVKLLLNNLSGYIGFYRFYVKLFINCLYDPNQAPSLPKFTP